MPAADRARIADSRPEPGPLTRTSTLRTPWSRARLAAFMAACWAANGVPLREPRKPSDPELFHEITFPAGSQMVTIGLVDGRVEFNQYVAGLDLLSIMNMDGTYDPHFKRLDDLGSPGCNDLSGRGSDNIDMAKRCPA